MNDPVQVNGRDYERQNIVDYLKVNGNKDPKGKIVNVNHPTYLMKSSLSILKLCKEARIHKCKN